MISLSSLKSLSFISTTSKLLVSIVSLTMVFSPKAAALKSDSQPHVAPVALAAIPTIKPQPKFPSYAANYQSMLTAQADCTAQGGTFSITGCAVPPPPVVVEPPAPVYVAPVYYAPSYAGLIGQIGWSLPGGNCVNMAIAYGKDQPGNPISWYTTTDTPFIGAAALFYFNHVAIVVGIWGNGDIEVAQENSGGAPHRYSQSEIRGYF